MAVEHINPEALLEYGGLTQVAVASGAKTAYIAGQTACDKAFNVVGKGSYPEQFREALKNLAIAVRAAGGDVDDIVSSTVYIKDISPDVAQLFAKAMETALDGKPFPAHPHSLIGVAALAHPDILVEISGVAVIGDRH